MKIILGADHGGFELKEKIKKKLSDEGYEIEDLGTKSPDSVDYPEYALKVAESVAKHPMNKGILICGTGIGMSIAANKVPGIRAAVCFDEFTTKMSRAHNNANILCLGQRSLDEKTSLKLVDIWLSTDFEGDKEGGGRHKKRVDKFNDIEKKYRS